MISQKLLPSLRETLFRNVRNVSILSTLNTHPVVVSKNKDIYTNLALEHWIYNNVCFTDGKTSSSIDLKPLEKPIVLIWTDDPCVVIGRHQNPWIESTLGFINKLGLKLARRHSGGGCVYHDENNINISIIGGRKVFDKRQDNLKFLAQVIDKKYGIKCEPTSRHDLIHSDSGYKISGSAAKLGKYNSYHHFTLLVDTDKEALYTAIRKEQQAFIHTNSSLSKRSHVINLKDIKSDLDVDQVIADLSEAYTIEFGGTKIESAKKELIEGDTNEFESLNKMREDISKWEWLYGMTPKFRLEKSFPMVVAGVEKHVAFNVLINKGLFESIEIQSDIDDKQYGNKFGYLIGTKFTYKEAMINTSKLLQVDTPTSENASFGMEQVFATFLLRMIHESNF